MTSGPADDQIQGDGKTWASDVDKENGEWLSPTMIMC